MNKSYSEWEKLIDEWILDKRNRAIVKLKLLDNITYESLAEEFDLSVRQTQRIVQKCKKELLKHI